MPLALETCEAFQQFPSTVVPSRFAPLPMTQESLKDNMPAWKNLLVINKTQATEPQLQDQKNIT